MCSSEGDTLELVSDLCVDSRNKLLPQLTTVARAIVQSERLKVKFALLSTSLPCFGALRVPRRGAQSRLEANVTALDAHLTGFSSFNVINTFVEKFSEFIRTISAGRCRNCTYGRMGPQHLRVRDATGGGAMAWVGEAAALVKGAFALSVFDCATAAHVH